MNQKNQKLPFWKWHFNLFPTIGIVVPFALLWIAKEKNGGLASKDSILYWFLVGAFSSVAFIFTIKKWKKGRGMPLESEVEHRFNQKVQPGGIVNDEAAPHRD